MTRGEGDFPSIFRTMGDSSRTAQKPTQYQRLINHFPA